MGASFDSKEAERRLLEGRKLGAPGYEQPEHPKNQPLASGVHQYLQHIETLKKPNTYRKYRAVLQRFSKHFEGRSLDAIPLAELNDYIVHLKRDAGLSANTVLHNGFSTGGAKSEYRKGPIQMSEIKWIGALSQAVFFSKRHFHKTARTECAVLPAPFPGSPV